MRLSGRFRIATALLTGLPAFALAAGPNDSPDKALHLIEGTMSGSTKGATADGVSGLMPQSPDLWYEYIAPEAGQLIVETCGSSFDTFLELWDGPPGKGGQLVAFNDDECDNQSVIIADMRADQIYTIRVAGANSAVGDFKLTIKAVPVTPPHAFVGVQVGEGGIAAPPVGPDVVYTDCQDVSNYGAIAGVRGYALGSYTCNVGTSDLRWGGSWQGSPSLAMNAYRLHNGRLEQIGLSFVKQACCAAAGSGCGIACNGVGGSMLGSGCLDVYSSGWNGGQSRLGARSGINAFTGAHTLATTTSGDAIFKRLQIRESDLRSTNFPGALYFVEGAYVTTDDATINPYNNSSYRRVTVSQTTFDMTPTGSTQVGIPAIRAWRAHGLGLNLVDTRVMDTEFDIPFEGRFLMAHKVTDLTGGAYRYEYAIYNLNSDRSGGSVAFNIPAGAVISNAGFKDVDYHSGEPYSNADWVIEQVNGQLVFRSPQTYAQNANSNALRWGTMYTFWFECNRPPTGTNGRLTFGLFKPAPSVPNAPASVQVVARVPMDIKGDLNCDGAVNNFDVDPFVHALVSPETYAVSYPGCRMMNADMDSSNSVTMFDIDPFLVALGAN